MGIFLLCKACSVFLVLVFVTLIIGSVGCRLSVATGVAPCVSEPLGGNISIEPLTGIFYNMNRVLPFPMLLIFHSSKMIFTVEASDGADKVEFFVDGELRFTDTEAPFEYTLSSGSAKFWKFTLSVSDGVETASVVVRWINLIG